MGGGIAMACANAGLTVALDRYGREAAVDRGMAAIRRNYSASVARGRLTSEAVDERVAAITPGVGYAAAATPIW